MSFIDEIYKKIGGSDINQDVSDWLDTGYLPFNYIVSGKYMGGGLPVGRITEIFGAESSGKTLLATMAMIATQKKGGIAVFLDYEHAFSISRAKQLGLLADKDKWIYKQPETAEDGFKIIEVIANAIRGEDSKKYITVVIDSVASMVTKEELEADYDEGNMRTRLSLPAVLSSSLKKVAGLVNKTNVTLIFLNQVRDNPGVMFGEKEVTGGGRALKFYASVRIKLSKVGKINDNDGGIIGEKVVAQVVKNKVFEPFKSCGYISNFKDGIDLELSHINTLSELGKLGNKKGYVEFMGKSYRASQLANMMKTDGEVKKAVLDLFGE